MIFLNTEVTASRNLHCVKTRERTQPRMHNWRNFRCTVPSTTVTKATEYYRVTLSVLLAKLRLQLFSIKLHRKPIIGQRLNFSRSSLFWNALLGWFAFHSWFLTKERQLFPALNKNLSLKLFVRVKQTQHNIFLYASRFSPTLNQLILLTKYHTLLFKLVARIVCFIKAIPPVDEFLNSHHLPALQCMDIKRRIKILITSLGTKELVNCEKFIFNFNSFFDLERQFTDSSFHLVYKTV